MKYFVLCTLWIGFGFFHSLMISASFTKLITRITGKYFAFYRLFYNLVSLGMFGALMAYTRLLDKEIVLFFGPPWSLIQTVLLVGSGAVMIWALFSYDTLEFLGIRQVQQLFKRKVSEPDAGILQPLTQRGLLGVVRHPMYLATLVFMWSLNSTRADILVHTILTLYIIIGIRLEERKLVLKYGDTYVKYQRAVPALIPLPRWQTEPR